MHVMVNAIYVQQCLTSKSRCWSESGNGEDILAVPVRDDPIGSSRGLRLRMCFVDDLDCGLEDEVISVLVFGSEIAEEMVSVLPELWRCILILVVRLNK